MSSNECAGLQTQYDVFSLDKAETLALLHGCGFSYEELKKPRVAVFNTLNPMNPGHIHQGAIAKAVAEGVREAGGLRWNSMAPTSAIVCWKIRSTPYPAATCWSMILT